MVYVTQLVYLRPGQEAVFEAFESAVLPLLGRYGGELLLRLRPTADNMVAGSLEIPHEIHLLRFASADGLAAFSGDDGRRRVLHLKEAALRSSLVVTGTAE